MQVSSNAAGGSGGTPDLRRYAIRSSDVLEDMRVNVCEEGSDRVIWYKERFVTDDEIMENIVDNTTSTILWTVHRPKRGWYIRMRPPSFPPGVFIPFLPVPQTSPYHTDAALSFSCRTNSSQFAVQGTPSSDVRPPALTKHSTDSDITLTDGIAPREHSYPPTPPTGPVVVVRPPSPRSVHAKLNQETLSPPRALRRLSQQPPVTITHFLLTPHSTAHVPEPMQPVSLFTRLMSVIKNNAPSRSYSFTLSPIALPLPASPTAPVARWRTADGNLPTPTPLLTFHDRTPVWTARCNSGLIEIDERQCRALGVEPAFYVAAALTYLEFLQERESYLVAASG